MLTIVFFWSLHATNNIKFLDERLLSQISKFEQSELERQLAAIGEVQGIIEFDLEGAITMSTNDLCSGRDILLSS